MLATRSCDTPMHPTSELILRACRSEPCSRLFLFNPPRDALAHELLRLGTASVDCFSQDYGDQQYLAASGISCSFGLLPGAEALPQHIILFLPREKARLEFLLHFLAASMPENAVLWLVGENNAGIKSAAGRLEQQFLLVQKLDAARHCVLYQATKPSSPGRRSEPSSRQDTAHVGSVIANHAARIPFQLDDYWQNWTLPTPQGDLQLQSLPGCFAHGRLDKGTEFLLEFLQSPAGQELQIGGRVIDFGCGVGVIGLVLKRMNPEIELTLLDSSASALESARATLAINDCAANLLAADGLDEVHGQFDWIISNPPFHKGVATDLDISQRMIARAPALLGNRGTMLLVVNRHLPYETWLEKSFTSVQRVAENREFKVCLAY